MNGLLESRHPEGARRSEAKRATVGIQKLCYDWILTPSSRAQNDGFKTLRSP